MCTSRWAPVQTKSWIPGTIQWGPRSADNHLLITNCLIWKFSFVKFWQFSFVQFWFWNYLLLWHSYKSLYVQFKNLFGILTWEMKPITVILASLRFGKVKFMFSYPNSTHNVQWALTWYIQMPWDTWSRMIRWQCPSRTRHTCHPTCWSQWTRHCPVATWQQSEYLNFITQHNGTWLPGLC